MPDAGDRSLNYMYKNNLKQSIGTLLYVSKRLFRIKLIQVEVFLELERAEGTPEVPSVKSKVMNQK